MSAAFKPCDQARALQCAVVLEALRTGPKTTAELRALLGAASSPAARVLNARTAGHKIVTEREGRQARYVLLGGDV